MYKNLESAIQSKGLTNIGIAELLGIHRVTFEKKLGGTADFNLKEIRKLNTLFSEYTFDYLYTQEPKTA